MKKSKFPFKIDIKKLARKLTLDRKYPSSILIKLKPAIKEINKNTDLNILFSHEKNNYGQTICTFDNLAENQLNIKPLTNSVTPTPSIPEEIQNTLPPKYQIPSIYQIIAPYCQEPIDKEFIISNIKYTLSNSQTNFPYYLQKSLENDYAAPEREKYKQQQRLKRDKELLEAKKRKEEEAQSNLGEQLYNSLSEEERTIYEQEARYTLKTRNIPATFINEFVIKSEIIGRLLSEYESQKVGTQEDLF